MRSEKSLTTETTKLDLFAISSYSGVLQVENFKFETFVMCLAEVKCYEQKQ